MMSKQGMTVTVLATGLSKRLSVLVDIRTELIEANKYRNEAAHSEVFGEQNNEH